MKKRDTTDRDAVAFDAPIPRSEVCRVEVLGARAHGRESKRRPEAVVLTPSAKVSREPAIVATVRKHKRFG